VKARAAAWALALSLASCRRQPVAPAFLVVEAPGGSDLSVAATRIEGRGVRAVTVSAGKLVVERDAQASGDVTVHTDGACVLRVAASELAAGVTARRTLSPYFDFGPAKPEVGFGKRLDIVARPGCTEAATRRIAWTQTSGTPLADLRLEQDGRALDATMPHAADALGTALPWGVVPVSPRTRGEVELRATWTADGHEMSHIVRASAAARSRGLPNVAVATRLYLGGGEFHVVSAPEGSHAAVEAVDGVPSFAPDRSGIFTLAGVRGKALRLYAGRYEETPLDCGRSDCHADLSASARSSPMATILQRGLDGPFPGDYPACGLACHAVGEPGVNDGGFVEIAARLGMASADLRRSGFHDLPAPLRRLGGVGCLACHGPGTIAEPSGHAALLRADVCATCHDAPPRYGHVMAWRTTRMARSDADPRTRAEPCARCHTTWGFLGQPARRPPDDAPPEGIACAACHAVHPARTGTSTVIGATCAAALARDVVAPALLDGALAPTADRSRACLGCHTSSPDAPRPAASAAAIWAGRGGLDPATGAALDGPSPHGGVTGGCVGCHRAGPEELGRGAGHAFAARAEACSGCHAERRDPSIRERALALWARQARESTTKVATSEPPHAAGAALDRGTPRGRAAWDVALVLEDPAADRHNSAYARALLEAAERVLGAVAPGGKP
jgi:hypothetical protein